ncbi:MAG: DUF2934 domain-containing protein [Kiritimatiellae bacterium]|nr:DUF2934 domain-containing protein [Kiritimatiellia bacterium]
MTMATETTARTTSGTTSRPRKKKATAEDRYLKIQAAAYYLAEKDGFREDAVEYWLAAEAKSGT